MKLEAGKTYKVVVFVTLANGKGFTSDPTESFDVIETIYPSISGFGISTDELTENGKITVSGTISGNGENIKTVQVSIFNEDGSKGGSIYRKDNVNAKTFNLSNVPAITMSTTAGSTNMKLEAGKTYKVVVFVTLANGKGFTSDPTESFDVIETIYPSISGFGISTDELTENGKITVSGTISGNGENIKTVQVSIFNEDGSKGGSIYRKDNVNAKTFNLSNVPAITMSTTAGSTNMKLEAGKTYKVVVFVTLANGKGFTSDPTESFDVIQKEVSEKVDLIWPCESAYTVTCLYYYKTGDKHSTSYGYKNAMDIAGGGNILAAEAGKVVTAKDLGDTSFGKYVVIEHADGSKTLYAHLKSYSVKEGDSVKQGQIIGVMGSSGNSSGVHLHFEYSAGDPWKDFYNAEYAENIIFEQNVRSNNDSYNSDKTVVEVIDSYYKKEGSYYYYKGNTAPSGIITKNDPCTYENIYLAICQILERKNDGYDENAGAACSDKKGWYTDEFLYLVMATAWTESSWQHYSSNGQVKISTNSDNTKDIGIMQLNDKVLRNASGDWLVDAVTNDWVYNLEYGMGSIWAAYREAKNKFDDEISCARGAYSRYNGGSAAGVTRWRDNPIAQDNNFYRNYTNAPWQNYVDSQTPTKPTDSAAPLIDAIKLSSSKISENAELTISTAASDNVDLKSIQLFVDDKLVKEWSVKGTYTKISHTVSGYSVGSYTVKVIAIDQSGNQNSVETTFTVEKKQGGEIYSVEMSSYNFKAGTTITFTVTTSADTEKIRLRNGTWIFPNEIIDNTTKNGKKVWVFEQVVNTVGVDRVLLVETYTNGWTGNLKGVTFTVEEESQDLPSFEIVLPISGQTIQVNTELKLQWSGSSVTPDRYVVNISGPSPYFVETTQSSVIIPASVFNVAGTYSISITSQKAGYNPYESKIVITCMCSHQSTKTQSSNYYYNNSANSSSEHSVTCVEELYCSLCGAIFNRTSTYNEKHEQSDGTCSCKCGYVFEGTTQIMYLNTSFPKNVYSQIGGDGEVIQTSKVGVVYPGQAITVCGSTKDYYIISYDATASRGSATSRTGYSLSRSATTPYNKIGYIHKDMLAKVPKIDDVYSVVLSDCYVLDYSSLTSLKINGNILAMCDPLKGIDQREAGTYDFLNGSDKLYLTIFKNGKKILADQFEKEGFTLLKIGGNVELDYSIGIEAPDCIAITHVDMYCEINLIYDDGKSNLMETVIECELVRNTTKDPGLGNSGETFAITGSCVWYNKAYYDYIINYKEPLWPLRTKSAMDERMFDDDTGEAISHMLLLVPQDAKFLAELCETGRASKALGAVLNFIKECALDSENIEEVYDEATLIFLKALDLEDGSVDTYAIAKELIVKIFKLENILKGMKPLEIISNASVAIFKFSQAVVRLNQWKDILLDNAENGYGTTIIFAYSQYGAIHRHCVLYKYGYRWSTWIPSTDESTNYFQSPDISGERLEGYLDYDSSTVLECIYEAYNYSILDIYPASIYFD